MGSPDLTTELWRFGREIEHGKSRTKGLVQEPLGLELPHQIRSTLLCPLPCGCYYQNNTNSGTSWKIHTKSYSISQSLQTKGNFLYKWGSQAPYKWALYTGRPSSSSLPCFPGSLWSFPHLFQLSPSPPGSLSQTSIPQTSAALSRGARGPKLESDQGSGELSIVFKAKAPGTPLCCQEWGNHLQIHLLGRSWQNLSPVKIFISEQYL